MDKNDLKQIIKEEYHNVKNFMEEKYGFAPELGTVVSNPYVNAFSSVNENVVDKLRNAVQKINRKYQVKVSTHPVTKGEIEIILGRGNHADSVYHSIEKLVKSLGIKHGTYSIFDESVNEGTESDVDMAVDQLQSSVEHAQQVIDKLKGRSNLEPWVQSLITKAEDYLNIVNNVDGGEVVEEYDVETIEETRDFVNFMKEYNTKLMESKINEAEYQGRKVELGKIMQGDVKKFKVYVNNDKDNVVKVNFGQKGMVIKKDNPEARKSFRARMNCDEPGPRWKARYWSCRKW